MMSGFARAALRRRIHRDARGLAPSIELPWMPPWGDELADDLVDLIADVLVLQADVADERSWLDDATGAQQRAHLAGTCTTLAARADAHALRATATTVREITASLRAWEAMAPRT